MLTPQKMYRAAELASQKLSFIRRARVGFINKYVGDFYAKSKPMGLSVDDRKATPLQHMYNAVTTYTANLAYADPKFDVGSRTLIYRDYSNTLGLAVNHLTQEIKLRSTLRRVVVDSLFLAGFVKTGITNAGTIEVDGVGIEIGQPYVERIDPDDIIIDPNARAWEAQEFVGHKLRVPREWLMESGLMDPDKVKKLTASLAGQSRASEVSGKTPGLSDIREYVELLELYIPGEKVVVTLPWQCGEYKDFLRVADYEGPETGPIHMLGYADVPDNVLPAPPCGAWADLHDLANRIARKLARQADRAKSVGVYKAGNEEDAKLIRDASDGDMVGLEEPESVRVVEYGEVSDSGYEFLQWAQQQFSQSAGNLEMLSGTGPVADTATEAEMLRASQGIKLADMSSQLYHFVAGIGRDLAFYIHTDPLIELPLVKRVQGQDVQVTYSPEMREGDFLDFHITVKPFSMQRTDPNQQLRRQMEFLSTVVPATVQATVQCAQVGIQFRIDQALKDVAQKMGLDDLDSWFALDPMLQRAMMMQEMVPPDGKAPGSQAGTAPPPMAPLAPAAPAGAGGFRVQQPVPTARAAPMDPASALASDAQQVAAPLQREYTAAMGGRR